MNDKFDVSEQEINGTIYKVYKSKETFSHKKIRWIVDPVWDGEKWVSSKDLILEGMRK